MSDSWQPIQRPAEIAETRLVEAIVSGQFPIHATLPAERQLAQQIGVTRSTLREALQRLARDGWLDIQHGKPTRVRDYWREGTLGVLAALAQHPDHAPADFVSHLLEVRALLAPSYTRRAITRAPAEVASLVRGLEPLADTPQAFAFADWQLHQKLTILSGNPIFTLVLNSFGEMHQKTGHRYYMLAQTRRNSRDFHQHLLAAADAGDPELGEIVMRKAAERSLIIWEQTKEMAS